MSQITHSTNTKLSNSLLWLFGSSIFVYILIRCFTVPPFCDEILNFHAYVRTREFIPFFSYLDPNNHFVSTSLNYLSFSIFGKDLLFMRLFEASGFLLFFYYLMKIRTFFRSQFIATCFIICICSSYFLIAYFSLARGYSLSIVFLLAAFYHLIQCSKYPASFSSQLKLYVFLTLAVWSNLAMLPTIGLLLLASIIISFKGFSGLIITSKIKTLLVILVIGVIPFCLAVWYSLLLKLSGDLAIGSNRGFIHDVIFNLSYETLGYKGMWFLFVGLLITFVYFLFNIKKLDYQFVFIVISYVFVGTIAGIILLNLLFDVNYPQNRAALHIMFLGVLFFFLSLDASKGKWRYFALYPTVIFAIHFILNLNLSYSSTWKNFTIEEEMYDALLEKQNYSGTQLTISGMFFAGVSTNYFSFINKTSLNEVQSSEHPNELADLLLVNNQDYIPNPALYDTMWYNKETDVGIFERKQKIDWVPIIKSTWKTIESNDSNIALNSTPFSVSAPSGIKVSLNSTLHCKNEVRYATIILTVKDSFNNETKSEIIILNQINESYATPITIKKSFCFNHIKQGDYTLCVELGNYHNYFWTINTGSTEVMVTPLNMTK